MQQFGSTKKESHVYIFHFIFLIRIFISIECCSPLTASSIFTGSSYDDLDLANSDLTIPRYFLASPFISSATNAHLKYSQVIL